MNIMKIVSMKNVFLGLASMCFALSASAAVSNSQVVDQQDGNGGYIKPHAPVDVRHKVCLLYTSPSPRDRS